MVSNDGVDVNQNADGRNTLFFTFSVENPAVGQAAPELTITASTNGNFTRHSYAWEYADPSRGGDWEEGRSAHQHGADYAMHPLYTWTSQNVTKTGYPTSDQYLSNNSQWLGYSLTGISIDEPTEQESYPLFVQSPKVAYSLTGQSSPWPCDNNTITVIMQSNVPLLDRCNPVVTVTGSGLANVLAPADGTMAVHFWTGERMDHVATGAKNAAGSQVSAAWSRTDTEGTLTFNLTSILKANPTAQEQQADGQDVLQFTFVVVNRHENYGDDGDLKLQYSLTSRGRTSETAMSGPVFSPDHTITIGEADWHTDSAWTTLYADDRATVYFDQSDAIAGNDRSEEHTSELQSPI